MNQQVEARITVREVTQNGYPVDIEGPGGESRDGNIPTEAEAKVHALTEQWEGLLSEENVASPQDIDTQAKECVRNLGQCLFQVLNAGNKMRNALDLALLSPDQSLRLQLRIRDDRIGAWPWELLYDVRKIAEEEIDSPFLALSPKVILSRYHEQPIAVPQPEKLEKLRVLVIVASPQDYGSLNQLAHQEIESLRLLGETVGRLELHVFENATPKPLWRYMTQVEHPFHIVHFIGHGYCGTSDPGELPKAGVVLEREDGRGIKVTPKEFARILRESQIAVSRKSGTAAERVGSYPRLVIISACHSAHTTFSVTNALVACGLPAVIGMRYQVSPALVIFFNQGLYAHLLDGYPIDQAVAECRRKLKEEFNRNLDWGIPILYLRARDGILFDFNADSEERKHWLEQLQLLRNLERLGGLADSRSEEAIHNLLRLGKSAVALSVAAVLAYPLWAIRAGAAALLRILPRTPEIHDNIVNLIGPALAREPEVAVRREMTRVLAQPRVSSRAVPFLNELTNDSDPEVRDIARAGLTMPTFSNDLNLVFDYIHKRLERVTTVLGQLSAIVDDVLQRGEDYDTYLQQVEDARSRARELQQFIAQAQRDAAGMTADEVWASLRPQVAEWVENTNKAMVVADQAARTSHSLASRLMLALDEVAKTLEFELTLMQELDEITQGLDGTIIADAQGDASIGIVRRAMSIGNEEDTQ
jgi:hypothetical protein